MRRPERVRVGLASLWYHVVPCGVTMWVISRRRPPRDDDDDDDDNDGKRSVKRRYDA